MMFSRLVMLSLLVAGMSLCGCGGSTEGVADAPEEAPVELTPEEEAGEQEYTNSPDYVPE